MYGTVFSVELRTRKSRAGLSYEDDDVFAFEDISPKAPVHVLIVPKKHFDSVLEADAQTLGALMQAAGNVARQLKLDADGFRPGHQYRRERRPDGEPSARSPAGRAFAGVASGLRAPCRQALF